MTFFGITSIILSLSHTSSTPRGVRPKNAQRGEGGVYSDKGCFLRYLKVGSVDTVTSLFSSEKRHPGAFTLNISVCTIHDECVQLSISACLAVDGLCAARRCSVRLPRCCWGGDLSHRQAGDPREHVSVLGMNKSFLATKHDDALVPQSGPGTYRSRTNGMGPKLPAPPVGAFADISADTGNTG